MNRGELRTESAVGRGFSVWVWAGQVPGEASLIQQGGRTRGKAGQQYNGVKYEGNLHTGWGEKNTEVGCWHSLMHKEALSPPRPCCRRNHRRAMEGIPNLQHLGPRRGSVRKGQRELIPASSLPQGWGAGEVQGEQWGQPHGWSQFQAPHGHTGSSNRAARRRGKVFYISSINNVVFGWLGLHSKLLPSCLSFSYIT